MRRLWGAQVWIGRLKAHQLNDVFVTSITAEETAPKPSPKMLEYLSLEVNVGPENMIMVGDTTYDMKMGKAWGAVTVAVTYGAHPREQLKREAPDHMVDTVADLGIILGRLTQ